MATKQTDGKKVVSSNEIGESGVTIFNGIISGEEYNLNLTGRKALETYDEMRRSDATVKASLTAVKQPIIGAEWFVTAASDDPQDIKIRDFAEQNLMEILDWGATLGEILTFLEFGFCVMEEVYKPGVVDNAQRIVLDKLAFRKQATVYKWEMDNGKPGVTQMINTGKTYSIPAAKLAIFTNQREGDNYEGISILRAAYQNWYYKKTLYQIDAVGHERQALGVVKIKYPVNATDKDRKAAQVAARNLRANEEAFIEEGTGWDINFMDMKAGTLKDVKPSIDHHDRQISKNVLAQFLEIGASGGGGTRSTSEDHSRLFELAIQAVAQNIADTFNATVMKTLIDLNFNVTKYPKLTVGKVGETNIDAVSTAIKTLTDADALHPTEQDEVHLRKLLRLPDMPEEDVAPKPDSSKPKNKEDADEIKAQRARQGVAAQVSERDFPGLYESLGIDTSTLGCIMLDVEKLPVMKYLPSDFADELVDATTRHDHSMGAVAETEPHVTLLFGLLENGNIWKDEVDTVLKDWSIDTVTIEEVGYFETSDSFAVVAHVELTSELQDGHDRLTLLPHVQTFSEYHPHITLAYVEKSADIDDWVDYLGAAYNGKTVKVTGINYGDKPKGDVEADLAQARQLHASLTGQLYGDTAEAA